MKVISVDMMNLLLFFVIDGSVIDFVFKWIFLERLIIFVIIFMCCLKKIVGLYLFNLCF